MAIRHYLLSAVLQIALLAGFLSGRLDRFRHFHFAAAFFFTGAGTDYRSWGLMQYWRRAGADGLRPSRCQGNDEADELVKAWTHDELTIVPCFIGSKANSLCAKSLLELGHEEGFGGVPVALDGFAADSEHAGDFLVLEAGKVGVHHHPVLPLIDFLKFFQGGVQSNESQRIIVRFRINVVEVDAGAIAATFLGRFCASVIDEDFAHGFGGGVVEMPAALPLSAGAAGHFYKGFVHQRRGL